MGLMEPEAVRVFVSRAPSGETRWEAFRRVARLALYLAIVPALLLSMGFGAYCDPIHVFPGFKLPEGGRGLSTYTTPEVSLRTFLDDVSFQSLVILKYTNHTEDSVYLERSIIYLDVTQDGSDGEGLVCDGFEVKADETGKGYHVFSAPLNANDGPLYMAQIIPESQRSMDKTTTGGVLVHHKTADELEYAGGLIGGGKTCEGPFYPQFPPDSAWDLAIPGWEVLGNRGLTIWEPQSIDCDNVPCSWTQR